MKEKHSHEHDAPVVARRKTRRGNALITTFGLLTILSIAGVSYIDYSTQSVRDSRANTQEVQATALAEAGTQAVLLSLWKPFKQEQLFDTMEAACAGATPMNPRATVTGTLPGAGAYAAGVIGFSSPGGDQWRRTVIIRTVGWVDRDNDLVRDAGEPAMTADVTANFELARSGVFDYTYFINNYGWMDGFQPSWLLINGDMRANGNFDFLNGSGTINGSLIAANNTKLSPPATGLVNQAPLKQSTADYRNTVNNAGTPHRTRMRQAYDPAIHGAVGTAQFEQWRDLVFMSDAQIQNNRLFGAAIQDSRGTQGWQRTTLGATPVMDMLDSRPSEEIVMPDLSDLNRYIELSNDYQNDRALWTDGTANPNFMGNSGSASPTLPSGAPNPNYSGAFLDVWQDPDGSGPLPGAYVRLTTDGVFNGSALLIGTAANPIRIHGPVTFTQDVAIKGVIQGQGTIYTGRNTHIIGSLRYANPPDFTGTNMQTIENRNEKRDFLGIAARGSVIMGNPVTFANPYPLKYMTPPFTKGRFDEAGNWIPPFDAMQIDGTGRRRFQSVIPDNVINANAEGVNQVDAILYTNFVGGGNVGTSGGGMTLNGTLIARDEAIVTWSLPIRMNYDTRIRERGPTRRPLIDLNLPRSPAMLRSAWQDRGFRRY